MHSHSEPAKDQISYSLYVSQSIHCRTSQSHISQYREMFKATALYMVCHSSYNSSYRTAPATELESYEVLFINLASAKSQVNNISKGEDTSSL